MSYWLHKGKFILELHIWGVFLNGDAFHLPEIFSKRFLSPEQHCYISRNHTQPQCITTGELGSCLFCHSYQHREQLMPHCKLLSVGSRMITPARGLLASARVQVVVFEQHHVWWTLVVGGGPNTCTHGCSQLCFSVHFSMHHHGPEVRLRLLLATVSWEQLWVLWDCPGSPVLHSLLGSSCLLYCWWHVMDTVYLLTKKRNLSVSLASGMLDCFSRLKYPPNSESCWDSEKSSVQGVPSAPSSPFLAFLRGERNWNLAHGWKPLPSSKTRYQQRR